MSLILSLALLAAPDPTAGALALGRRLAETGTLATLLPLKTVQERGELVAEHPDWSEADKAALRQEADAEAKAGIDRLMDAMGRGYAEKLSIEDLKALVAFNESPVAKRARDATPGALAAAMSSLGNFDYKGNVRAAFCRKTGKGCDK